MSDPTATGRRGFLKMTAMAGGLAASQSAPAGQTDQQAQTAQSIHETKYEDRTDSVEEKLRLLAAAYRKRDYRLSRALAASLRETLQFEQHDQESSGEAVIAPDTFGAVDDMPEPWRRWARTWRYYKVLDIQETAGAERSGEPVEALIGFRGDQADSLRREVRIARVEPDGGLREVACQVSGDVRRETTLFARVQFLAHVLASGRTTYLVFYGNPDAELPSYPSDLTVSGEGFGLDIENDYYVASLSRQMGQLERLKLKREHGLELFAGGEGHGEPPGIDWAHDYVASNNFQKFRITNWPTCPDYEVIRGPLCVTVRRWGFPNSTIHPLFTPSRMNIFVEYRFYAGAPYFIKEGSMEVIKDMEITYLRDDEWVFSGHSFTDTLWMGRNGKLRTGPVDAAAQDDLWATGFFHRVSRDAFLALFLKHEAEGVDGLKHTGAPQLYYKWHGPLWSRALFQNARMPKGSVLRQKNAYLVLPFPEQGGAEMAEGWRQRLINPLVLRGGDLPSDASATPGSLARPGEAADSVIDKQRIWEALADCKDYQLYTADVSVVDLGLIYDVRVRGETVHVVMTMPHRGRPRHGYFAWGSGGNLQPIRDRLLKLPGVRKVVVEPVWEPAWSSNRVTEKGRRALGLPD